jgi:hypothetical protein
MAELTEGIRRALRNFLAQTPVQRERNPRWGYGPALERYENELLAREPWNRLLKKWDVYAIAQRVLAPLVEEIPADFEGDLNGVRDHSLVERMERTLAAFLESLPRPYHACFKMRALPTYGAPKIDIGPGIWIYETSAAGFDARLLEVERRGLRLAGENEAPRLQRNSVYLCFSVPGYADGTSDTHSIDLAHAKLKHFVFVSIGLLNVLKPRDLGDLLIPKPYKPREYDGLIFNPDDIDNEFFGLPVPVDLADYLDYIRIDETKLLVAGGEAARTADEKIGALPAALADATWFDGLPELNKDAEPIRASMEWYIESEITGNQTMSMLQASIGLEALLGDEDKGRVTEKLADRYAYLAGKTVSEREELREKFLNVYSYRSHIVHGRRTSLGLENLRHLINARAMLSTAIGIEFRLLKSAPAR